jgi:hypothetical protein
METSMPHEINPFAGTKHSGVDREKDVDRVNLSKALWPPD